MSIDPNHWASWIAPDTQATRDFDRIEYAWEWWERRLAAQDSLDAERGR